MKKVCFICYDSTITVLTLSLALTSWHQDDVEALILPDWSDHVVADRGVLFKAQLGLS